MSEQLPVICLSVAVILLAVLSLSVWKQNWRDIDKIQKIIAVHNSIDEKLVQEFKLLATDFDRAKNDQEKFNEFIAAQWKFLEERVSLEEQLTNPFGV